MPHKAKLLGWLRSDAAKVFSEYIGELKAGLEQRLLVNPKRFVTHKVSVAGENGSIEQAIDDPYRDWETIGRAHV